MPSFSPKYLVALAFFGMVDIGEAERIPKARGASIAHGIPMTGKSLAATNTPTSIQDFQDLFYLVDVVLGGQQFEVILDTGSSDFWVQPTSTQTVQFTNKTDLTTQIVYGIGNMSGNIEFAQLEFSGFTVPSQAFILATSVENIAAVDLKLGAGTIGLGFENLSHINHAIEEAFNDPTTTVGASPIFNILSQDSSISSSFDIQLERTSDLNDTAVGTLTIGSHLAGFENVTTQPRLPTVSSSRWSVASDGMAVNGVPFKFNQSSVPGVASGKIATLLDSGYSLPPLPPQAVDFIYSSIPGAMSYQTDEFQWIVPCTGTTNLTFTLGNVDFPIHYLDLTVVSFVDVDIHGQTTNVTFCFNAYHYYVTPSGPATFTGFDAILGDAFLRNVYASFNYGNITAPSEDESYVQLVSTTNLDTALPDFKTSRAKTLASLPEELSPAQLVEYVTTPNGASSLHIKLHSLMKGYGLVSVGFLAGNMLGWL